MPDRSINILSHTSSSFCDAVSECGARAGDAMEAYRRAYRNGDIASPAALRLPELVNQHEEDSTTKFILRLDDGLETESVIIPMQTRGDRLSYTLCVSSQVGCAMGCTFCETAQMGLMKNLSAADIVSQWFTARHVLEQEIKNIVFMGMGEPMDNLDAVLDSIHILTDRNGAGIAPADIAVSTVGRADGIRHYARFASEEGYRKLKLAVSINAPNDVVRSAIMPINRATPMRELMDAMLVWTKRGTPVLIEYVLIPGVNDQPEHANELCEYLRPLNCKVNLIPYNPRRDSPWPAPTEHAVDRFYRQVARHGLLVTRRRTLGRDVMAACGQLGNPGIRRRQLVSKADR